MAARFGLPDLVNPGIPGTGLTLTPNVSETNKTCPNEGETDNGTIMISIINQAMAAAIAGYQLYKTYEIAQMQKDIAEKYQQMANESFDYYMNTFKPLEEFAVDMACNEPIPEEGEFDENTAGKFAISGRVSAGKSPYAVGACVPRHCTGHLQASLVKTVLADRVAAAVGAYTGYIWEVNYIKSLQDKRWKRRESMLKVGRDMNGAFYSLSQYATSSFGDLRDQASASATSAIYSGFNMANREPTMFPERQQPQYRDAARQGEVITQDKSETEAPKADAKPVKNRE